MNTDIRVGDDVVAIHDGGRDPDGFPTQAPVAGQRYKITGIYRMPYGLGCQLQGMDHWPYRGYCLYVKPKARIVCYGTVPGWYFRKLEPDTQGSDIWFAKELRKQLAKVV